MQDTQKSGTLLLNGDESTDEITRSDVKNVVPGFLICEGEERSNAICKHDFEGVFLCVAFTLPCSTYIENSRQQKTLEAVLQGFAWLK